MSSIETGVFGTSKVQIYTNFRHLEGSLRVSCRRAGLKATGAAGSRR